MSSARKSPPFALFLLLAWAAVATWLVFRHAATAGNVFPDPDDAMRLAQVRAFIGGRGWFDLLEPRLSPPEGYLTHWSRLIDVGLAGLFWLARPFASAAAAEKFMLCAWPVLWLLPAMGAVAAIAWRCGGRAAAQIALVLAVFAPGAFQHFLPGQIDHHNVQIALALLAVAAAAWSDRSAFAACAAGALSALAFAVGLENLPWIALAGVAVAARFVADARAARALCRYALALAGGTAVAFLGTVAPARWLVAACDALAFNLALPVIAGGAILAIVAAAGPRLSRRGRIAGVGVAAVLALALYAGAEPRCLQGPYALVDPAVQRIWLSHVEEMAPLAAVLRTWPLTGASIAAFPLLALAAILALLRTPLRRDSGFWIAAGAAWLAALLTLAMVKTYSYALWFAIPPVALGVAAWSARRKLPLSWQLGGALAVTPAAVSAFALVLAQATGLKEDPPAATGKNCQAAADYAALAALPPGLVLADIDLGPMVLLKTPHAVLAAPYHRLAGGIVRAHGMLTAAPDAARPAIAQAGIGYIVLCGNGRPAGPDAAARPDNLRSRLAAGEAPDWLARVPLPEGTGLMVYRARS